MGSLKWWRKYACGLPLKTKSHSPQFGLGSAASSCDSLLPDHGNAAAAAHPKAKKGKQRFLKRFSKPKKDEYKGVTTDTKSCTAEAEEGTQATDSTYELSHSVQDESDLHQYQPLVIATQNSFDGDEEAGGIQTTSSTSALCQDGRAASEIYLVQHSPSTSGNHSGLGYQKASSVVSLPITNFRGSAAVLQHENTTTMFVQGTNGTIGCCKQTTYTETSVYDDQQQQWQGPQQKLQQQQQQRPMDFPMTSLEIKRIGNQSWNSEDGRCFEELPVKSLPSTLIPLPRHSTITIWKTGQMVWHSEDKRLFEEIQFPPNGARAKTGATAAAAYPSAAAAYPSVDTVPCSIPTTASGHCKSATRVERTVTDVPSGRLEINDHMGKENVNKISSSGAIQHPSDAGQQCGKSHKVVKKYVKGFTPDNIGKHQYDLDVADPEERSTPNVSLESCADSKTQNLDEYREERANNSSAMTHSNSVESDSSETGCQGHQVRDVINNLVATKSQNRSVKPPDYDKLICFIATTLRHFGVSAIYCPAPGDYHKVLVQGRGVMRWEENIKHSERKFKGYIITVRELKEEPDWSHDQPPPILTNYLKNSPKLPFYVNMKSVDEERKNTHVATVGVFVKSSDSRHSRTVFAVTVAHAITKETEQNLLRGILSKNKTREVCKSVIGRNNLDEHLTICSHNQSEVDVRDSPFIAFSRYIPMERSHSEELRFYQKFAMDIALLPVDPETLDPKVLSKSPEKFVIQTHVEKASLSSLDAPPKETCIGGYIDIHEEGDIELLVEHGITVFVDGTRGKVVMQPKTFEPAEDQSNPSGSSQRGAQPSSGISWKLAPHIAITTEDALIHGNSGAPVMAYNNYDQKLYILGLLMGAFTGGDGWCKDTIIYQVAPLGPALKQLQFLYPDHLGELRLAAGQLTNGLTVNQSLRYLHGAACYLDDSNVDTGYHGDSSSLDSEGENTDNATEGR